MTHIPLQRVWLVEVTMCATQSTSYGIRLSCCMGNGETCHACRLRAREIAPHK
jgi:hypothetical protein